MALLTTLDAPSLDQGGYLMRASIYLDGQSAVENRSWGHTDILAIAGGGLYDSTASGWGFSLSNAQSGGTSGTRAPDFSGGSFWLATSVSWSSTHLPDGTRSMYAELSWDGTYPGGWFANGFSGSKTVVLPQITRGGGERWSGTAWLKQIAERWDGAAWKRQIVERWTGTTWTRQQ